MSVSLGILPIFSSYSGSPPPPPIWRQRRSIGCCFDKMLCSNCSLSDLLLNVQRWRYSNSTTVSMYSVHWLVIQSDLPVMSGCVCAINLQYVCADFQRGIVTTRDFLLPPVVMMKNLHMDCSNVSFLASDLLLDLSTFNQFFFFFCAWNRFSSSTSASDIVNRKSDRAGQQTKLSTSSCRYKCRLKFCSFLHDVFLV